MNTPTAVDPALYLADETAWLDAMADLIRDGRLDDLDYPNLAEYLSDMANRDRREVRSRLVVLLSHVLKWNYQPERRSGSWRASILVQRNALSDLAGTGVLRNHAIAVLPELYEDAVEIAAAETGLSVTTFPAACPYTLDELLSPDVPG